MGNVYIGVNNIAKKVNSIYVGVNNIARKVSKAYVGVSNKARLVYTNGSGVNPTKSSFTVAEINALAAYGELGKVNVGATVTLANSYDTNRSVHTYVIIGVNHDSTTNTADLWPTGCINKQVFSTKGDSNNYYKRWKNADIRTYGNSTYKSGFSDVTQTHMKQMTVQTYYGRYDTPADAAPNDTTTDYIKLLSVKEFNISPYHESMNTQEGNTYSSYFSSLAYNDTSTNAKKRYASATGTAGANFQWTRSCFISGGTKVVWCANSNGVLSAGGGNYFSTGGFCPCFRLGA